MLKTFASDAALQWTDFALREDVAECLVVAILGKSIANRKYLEILL
jgi:hypothetical protein